MPLWKTILSYDGTHLHGWQIQAAVPSVQGHLSAAIAYVTGDRVLPQGSGRTDAGVHALGQVASFRLGSPIPPANLLRALNHVLPASIRVLSAEIVEEPFHARHSARTKTYEYRIFPRRPLLETIREGAALPSMPGDAATMPGDAATVIADRICSPMLAPFVWDCGLPLSLAALEGAAAQILGTHDFTSFAAAGSDALARVGAEPYVAAEPLPGYFADGSPEGLIAEGLIADGLIPGGLIAGPSPCRTILHSRWTLSGEGLLVYRITGTGFLHHMVRNLIGTFALAGSGRLGPEGVAEILAARRRSAAGPTAPARGLFLVEVQYA